jgi:hypothetical protein
MQKEILFPFQIQKEIVNQKEILRQTVLLYPMPMGILTQRTCGLLCCLVFLLQTQRPCGFQR